MHGRVAGPSEDSWPMKEEERERIAAFRFGVISDLMDPGLEARERWRRLREKASRVWSIPGSGRTRISVRTMREWLAAHRARGFDGLRPSGRSDEGSSRALRAEIQDLVVRLLGENPRRSVPTLLKEIRLCGALQGGEKISSSTVYRFLGSRGLAAAARRRGDVPARDRRRFAFANPGDMWHSDVMHGPQVRTSTCGQAAGAGSRKTYLVAFLDDATRVIPHAAFTMSENLESFLPVFKQGILKRGLPQRLFVDPGALYRSEHLSVVTARLGIALIHARA